MWSSAKFRVEPGFFLLLALSVLLGAGNVLPVLLLAAACHEGAHLGVLALFRIPVKTISLTAAGIEIQAPMQTRLSYGRELLAVAAGPLCNLVLALLAARWAGWYLFAGASFLLGLFNLLPAEALDGGRLLYLALSWVWEPVTAYRICRTVGRVTVLLLLLALTVLLMATGQGLLLLAGALALLPPPERRRCQKHRAAGYTRTNRRAASFSLRT